MSAAASGSGERRTPGRTANRDPRAEAAAMAQALGPDADELSALIHRLDAR